VGELRTAVLEIDLRLSADGHVMLMHDNTLDRTTNGHGPLAQLSLAQLKALDAAAHYPALRGQGVTVPTLDEAMRALASAHPHLIFIWDIKDARVVPLVPEVRPACASACACVRASLWC